MAESAVFIVLENIANLQEGETLLGGVMEEVECIRNEFQRITAFLKFADVTEERDLEFQVWVKQLEDAANDTEVIIDKFLLGMAHPHQGNGLLRKALLSMKTLKARHRFALELQSIRSRVSELAERHQRYQLKFSTISEIGSSSSVGSNKWYDPRGEGFFIEENELVGMEEQKQQLIKWLVEEEEGSERLNFVSVVGMAGVGKTTLVKTVYDDSAVQKHFHSHVWLSVSDSPNFEELLKYMVLQLFNEIDEPVPGEVEMMTTSTLQQIIKEFLRRRRYLVVLDDVWRVKAMEDVKSFLPDNNFCSRVMLTTRLEEIAASASRIGTDCYIYHLKPLSWEESWTLFCRKTFWGKSSCPPHLEEISRRILSRCEGLPLAIVAIGAILATKDQSRIGEWDMVDRSLGVQLKSNDKLQSMKNILSLSYNDLPFYLKFCFLYLSIFPVHYEIECTRLIRLWMAEGIVQDRRAGMTIEEVAESYLHQLLNSSLIQVTETTEDGRIKTCRVHQLLHDFITLKSREQNIAAIASEAYTLWREKNKLRRLSIHSALKDVPRSMHFSRLRSLFMFGVTGPESMSSMSMLFNDGGLKLLKVLDMKGASLETLPDEIFQLFYLRYLSLRGTKVKMLPRSIANLQSLQTLDLKDTYVTKLPVEIQKLQKLRHLLVYRYDTLQGYEKLNYINGFKASTGIGCLSSLQKLCYIDASNGFKVEELGRLTQLRRLGILKLRREDGMALCSSIEKLSNLRSLAISSVNEDEIVDIQSLFSPPYFLRRLYLRGRLEKLPNWIASLHSLVRVQLEWSKLEDHLLQSLQNLPNLVQIELHRAYEAEELCFRSGGFQKLKTLRLSELNNLKLVVMEKDAMPRLEKLYISNCELLEEVPSGIQYLVNLKLLDLGGVAYRLYRSLNSEMEGKDYWKIAHIPTVYIQVTRSHFSTSNYEKEEGILTRTLGSDS